MCTEPAQHPAIPTGTPTQQGRISCCIRRQLLRPPHEVYALDLGIDSAMPLRHPQLQHIGLAHAGSAHIVGHIFGVHGISVSATISHHFVKVPSAQLTVTLRLQ